MNKFRFLINISLLITFSTSSLLADMENSISPKEENKEVLEDEVEPLPIPTLIDLTERKKQGGKPAKYSALALLVFNIVMFTAGMALVKSIDGKDV